MKNIIIALSIFASPNIFYGQKVDAIKKFQKYSRKADSLYNSKDYKGSGLAYSEAFKYGSDEVTRYNAACVWALANYPDSAFSQLNVIAVNYKFYKLLIKEADLNSLHTDKRWDSFIQLMLQNQKKAEANMNWTLVAKLDSIESEDQKYRQQLDGIEKKFGVKSKQMDSLWKIINEKDSINLVKVKAILDTYGWLGPDVVGNAGNSTLFLVIQHSNQKTQEKYLPLMKEAVKNKKAHGSDLALLEDRVLLGQGRRQIYGSQIGRDSKTQMYFVSPLQDPDNVDERRAEVGLSTLAEYVSHWNIKWDVAQYKRDLPSIEAKEKANRK